MELVHLGIYHTQIHFVAIITKHCYKQQHVTVATKHALSVSNCVLQRIEVYDKNTHNFPFNTHARTHDQPTYISIKTSFFFRLIADAEYHCISPNHYQNVNSIFHKPEEKTARMFTHGPSCNKGSFSDPINRNMEN